MVPVNGRPLLEYNIELLREHGVREIAINLHAHADAIADYFGDGSRFGVDLTYSFEPQLLGTAGAVKELSTFFDDGPFYVIYGDVLTRLDLGSLLEHHRASGAVATIALHEPEDATRCGVVQQDEKGWITHFIEKPQHGTTAGAWANAGIYVMDPAALDHVKADVFQDFGNDVFPELLANGEKLAGLRSEAVFWDVGSTERLRLAEDWLRTEAGLEPRRAKIAAIADDYFTSVQEALAGLDRDAIVRVAELLLDARERGNQVLIVGNGGSSATASHMAADLMRAASDSSGPPLRCRSLTDNVPALTAWSNDVGYESAFELQMKQAMEPGDILIAISASGRSPNIIGAVNAARMQGATVVGLVGFGGGTLAEIADVAVVVPSDEYGPVEDIHLLFGHLLTSEIRLAAESEGEIGLPQTPIPALHVAGAAENGRTAAC
jgi:phosphoheptose isomerase/UTP-glucose-1-phosphate uridylyltransferase